MPDEMPEQWAARSRREQGVSECVEDQATVADLALAVLEASEGGGPMAEIRRLPGRARPREEVLREYQESNAKVRRNIPAVLWDFLAPDPDQFYRWRVTRLRLHQGASHLRQGEAADGV
jgi:hypothetical protein